jgi:ubiquinone/menaquinone biosynthesis C-methylase UbiE
MSNTSKFKAIMNPEEFKNKNREHWKQNTEYWTNNKLRQVEDTREFLKGKIIALTNKDETIVVYDYGYGNCWLLELLIELDLKFEYVGFDFNKEFVSIYSEKYKENNNISFVYHDLETPLTNKYHGKADFVFTLFTLFEIPQASKVFENINISLNDGGHHIMLSIDSFYLMLALSDSIEELKEIMKKFDDYKLEDKTPYFFQDIDLGNGTSEILKYASVLYTTSDYLKLAKKAGLNYVEFDELIKTGKFMPKIYQYYDFQK